MSLKLLIASVLGVLSSSSPLPQCEEGSCASPAEKSFPQDDTSLLQVKSAVTHGAMANGTALAMLAEEAEPNAWLQAAIAFLDTRVETDGLWRKAGSKEQADKLELAWKSEDFAMDDNPHTVTLAVGRRLQKDPLFSVVLTTGLCGLGLHYDPAKTNENLEKINGLLSMQQPLGLTPQKFADLTLLLGHWKRVNEKEAVNQMNLNTLTTCTFVLIGAPAAMGKCFTLKNPDGKIKINANLGFMIENPDGVHFIE